MQKTNEVTFDGKRQHRQSGNNGQGLNAYFEQETTGGYAE